VRWAAWEHHLQAPSNAVQIMTTETNSVSYNPGKQTTDLVNALYSVAVLLINTDPNTTYPVSITGLDTNRLGGATVYFYGENSASVSVTHTSGHNAST
jgi:hypothetical protein